MFSPGASAVDAPATAQQNGAGTRPQTRAPGTGRSKSNTRSGSVIQFVLDDLAVARIDLELVLLAIGFDALTFPMAVIGLDLEICV